MIASDDRFALEIFMGIAALAFAFGFWIRRREQVARGWPQASGVIVTSTTLRQPLANGNYEVSPVIEYEFSYDGRSFRSDHWRPLNFSFGNSISAQAVCWVPFSFGILFVALSALAVLIFMTRR